MWVASFSSQLWFEMKGSGKNPFCNCVFDFLSITQKIVAASKTPLYFKYENANMYTSENTASKKRPILASSWLILLVRKFKYDN